MKSIFLSIIVISALVIAALGGTFATWSDSETSAGNYIETGSLDLKVNGADDAPWGEGVPIKVGVTCVVPDVVYGPYEVELWNAGQCTYDSQAFLHVKRVQCYNVEPKVNPYPDGGSAYWPAGESTGYEDPDTGIGDYVPAPSLLKPEPELVAEYGGKVDCTTVVGIGPEGDDCSMGSHTVMIITDTDTDPYTADPDRTIMISDELGKWLCKEIYLFDLAPCQPETIYIWFYVKQDREEDWARDYIPDPYFDTVPDLAGNNFLANDPDYAAKLLHWEKFNDWPSNALMKDKVEFDVEFDLVLLEVDD